MAVLVKRDGKLLKSFDTELEAMHWLHRQQPQSVDWATKYEGYSIERVDENAADRRGGRERIRRVRAQLDGMRKPQEFLVTRTDKGNYIVQSDKSIGMFDPVTGDGVLNIHGSYFPHLHERAGAKPFHFPSEFVQEAQEARVYVGQEFGPGGIYMGTTEIGGEERRRSHRLGKRLGPVLRLGGR